ncbi:MAG TPA: demethoxyubiquinone hydroxylase family protein, partial [Methylophaga aminisulfidivorans]|nr:demethoxyubiquinone hydroxylase family protein [Methylophaga aminisulfidivorans]
MQRDSTIVDQAIIHFDKALSTLFGLPQTTQRDNPANKVELTEALTAKEADLSAR